MQRLDPRQKTRYPPLEQGQVLEINPHCMKVNFGFRFIRGILTGLLALSISLFFVIDLIASLVYGRGGEIFFDYLSDLKSYYYIIAPIITLELYLWPSAPPMIFDRVNRRVIFQVFFRTKIIDWNSCVATVRYFAQATEGGATQGYNLRIEGEVINEPDRKPQRAAALIHQSGVSEDLFNYWEYIRCYMDGGPEAVPIPMKLYHRNIVHTPFKVYWAMLPKPAEIWAGLRHPKSIWTFFAEVFFACFLVIALLATPLIIPLFMMHMLAVRFGRVRRYPKEIRQLCREGQEAAAAKSNQTASPQPSTSSTAD